MRVGIGYDIHRFSTGRKLILGGVEILYEKGLSGHSDADVLCHAIMDSLLGAAGLPDIGVQFPDKESRYKDISSLKLMKKVRGILSKEQWRIVNVDATIIAEEPRISPWIDRMKEKISGGLEIEKGQIGIKCTTNEGLGFIGRKEGIAALATALIDKKSKI